MKQRSLTLLPIALGVQLALSGGAFAADKAKDSDKDMETITVTASADASADGLIGAYAGGQVARGQKAGLLGTTDYMNSPFNGLAFTDQYMKDIQAQGIGDVIQNDPGVRVARGFGNFQESYFIRGFLLSSDEIAYNGLYGVLPRQYVAAELIERVEVLRGASAFLNGMAPGGGAIGGSINLVPKRASNDEKTDITLGFNDQGQGYGAADISRRFGSDGQHGIRVNVAHRDGDTGVDGEKEKTDLASLGYDWRGERARVSADATFQEHKLYGGRPNVTLSGTSDVPAPPKADANYAQDWTHSNEKDWFGTLRGEYDLSDNITAWAAVGGRYSKEDNSLANLYVTDSQSGAANTYRADNAREDTVYSGEVGLRGQFDTGPVSHKWVVAGSYYDLDSKNAYAWSSYLGLATNLYHPVQLARPITDGFTGGDMSDPRTTSTTKLPSLAFSDTLGFLDDKLLLTLGGRYQHMDLRSYAYGTADQTSKYSKSRFSPSAGLVYKATDAVSLYANYIEALAQGDTAGTTTLNPGTMLSPYVSKQKELGVKVDTGSLGGTFAVFTTSKPGGYVNEQNIFGEYGKDRHRGAELTVFGEPVEGLRVLGGVTYLDAKQKDVSIAANEGNRVIGTAKWQGNLGLQWDLPWVYGLSLDMQAISTGARYADAANTLEVAGWTRYDLGAKYGTTVMNHDVTFHARLENLTDKEYWASVGGYPGNGYLVQGAPRTFSLSASMAF